MSLALPPLGNPTLLNTLRELPADTPIGFSKNGLVAHKGFNILAHLGARRRAYEWLKAPPPAGLPISTRMTLKDSLACLLKRVTASDVIARLEQLEKGAPTTRQSMRRLIEKTESAHVQTGVRRNATAGGEASNADGPPVLSTANETSRLVRGVLDVLRGDSLTFKPQTLEPIYDTIPPGPARSVPNLAAHRDVPPPLPPRLRRSTSEPSILAGAHRPAVPQYLEPGASPSSVNPPQANPAPRQPKPIPLPRTVFPGREANQEADATDRPRPVARPRPDRPAPDLESSHLKAE
ncbi:hypothetical protein PTE30175_01214 [Pandoraea terrae]|uniref:Uncharacterized protein n=1 Tax=Pandoraea terrae TaxID=1537710 RepID=A0A5E4TDM6_9BURK|nr:hypothetical protein [Pandoraea terrae]VVD84209.1 hypothetical protein PTE30175_01214 [Pandoraea terrae]